MNLLAKSTLAALLLTCGLPTAQASAATSGPAAGYNQLVDAVVARYHLPGIAVGVIDDGKIVYTHTTGTLASGKPIDADTLFEIGSTTKAMTVTLLARLVQAGKLRWDAPVTQYLPAFRMYDPWVTRNMQVGDLLSHHSGLHGFAGDLMLWPHPSQFTPADVVHALRYLKPAYSFRAGYAYDNVLYVTAGQVAAAAGGAPYPQLLRREVFLPLGMDRCQIGTWNRAAVGNVARPHILDDGRFVAVASNDATRDATTMDAAGGVSCSLRDMLAWAMNWLAPTPRQLAWLTPDQRQKEWTPYTPVPISPQRKAWNDTLFFANGYGWRLSDADGEMTVWHTGVLEGMRAAVMLLPHRRSGFVVLINSEADAALSVLDEVLLKHFTAPNEGKSVAMYADEQARYDARDQSPAPDTSAGKPATPEELRARLGIWQDPWFGKVAICAKGNSVRFVSQMSPLLSGRVMHMDGGYFVHWDHGDPDAWLRFPVHAGGTLSMALVDANQDASSDFGDLAFTRKQGCD